MNAQQTYNELLEDGFAAEFLNYMVNCGMSLPLSKRYSENQEDDE